MPDTPIYAITYPASTALVTDGASAMQTISTDVETALNTQAGSNDGRNYLDNPRFAVNFRNSQTITAGTQGYIADRWIWNVANATSTFTRTTIPIGTTGLDTTIAFGMSANTTTSTLTTAAVYFQQILDGGVEKFGGDTLVLSFYAKASSGTPKVGARLVQNFGTGGAPSAEVALAIQTATISTSWARYSLTFTLASVAGKTLGTNADDGLRLELWTSGGSATVASAVGNQQGFTIEVTGIQLEQNYRTPFEYRYDWNDALRCQRYFQTSYQDSIWLLAGGAGAASGVGKVQITTTTTGANVVYYSHRFTIAMPRVPTFRFYTQSTGLVGSWDYDRSGASGTVTIAPSSPSGAMPNGILAVTGSLGVAWSAATIQGHYTASIDGW